MLRILRNKYTRGLLPTICLLLTAYCLPPTAYCQSTGGVKGKVRNMRGETVAGATITARQNGRDLKSVTSNGKGEFALGGLESGIYSIVFDAKGYSLGVKSGVEVKQNKTVDLGERLILQVDRGTRVIVKGSVFFKDGTSVPNIEVRVEQVEANGSKRKIATVMTNVYGEFTFTQSEGPAKFRMTVKYKDTTATKDLEVDSAAIYRLAISLPIERPEK